MAKSKSRLVPASPQSTTGKKAAPVWVPAFLAAYRLTGNMTTAAAAAGIDRTTPYQYAEVHPEFATELAAAREEAADLLEAEALRRATKGVQKLKFYEGAPIMIPKRDDDGRLVLDARGREIMVPYVEHEHSDLLLIFLMKAARPEKYRENYEVKHTGEIAQVHVYLPQKDPTP